MVASRWRSQCVFLRGQDWPQFTDPEVWKDWLAGGWNPNQQPGIECTQRQALAPAAPACVQAEHHAFILYSVDHSLFGFMYSSQQKVPIRVPIWNSVRIRYLALPCLGSRWISTGLHSPGSQVVSQTKCALKASPLYCVKAECVAYPEERFHFPFFLNM